MQLNISPHRNVSTDAEEYKRQNSDQDSGNSIFADAFAEQQDSRCGNQEEIAPRSNGKYDIARHSLFQGHEAEKLASKAAKTDAERKHDFSEVEAIAGDEKGSQCEGKSASIPPKQVLVVILVGESLLRHDLQAERTKAVGEKGNEHQAKPDKLAIHSAFTIFSFACCSRSSSCLSFQSSSIDTTANKSTAIFFGFTGSL